jgi:hypothetical protein
MSAIPAATVNLKTMADGGLPEKNGSAIIAAPKEKCPMTAIDVAKEMAHRVAELNRLLESLDEAGRERATWWKVEKAVLQAWVDSGCRNVTSMGGAIAETYACDPKFYRATFCASCRAHLPVEEFVWVDDQGRETTDVVGS